LFTVGIVLTELLLIRPLFSGKNELEILTRISRVDLANLERYGQGIPKSRRRVIEGALQRDRDKRFATASEFANALLEVARAEGLVLNGEQLAGWLRETALLGSSNGGSASLARSPTPSPRRPESGARRTAASRDVRVALRAAQGAQLGTLALTELLSRIATGRVPLDVLASVDGGPFVPLSSVPAVSGLCARPAYRFVESESGPGNVMPAARRTVRFERRTLAGQLFDAVRREVSGLCEVRSGERARRLFFRGGSVEFVASTDTAELLGELAVAEGAVGAAELDDCLLEAAATGSHLGEVLMTRGHLRATAVARLLTEQRERRIASMFAWTGGVLSLDPTLESGERLPSGAGPGYGLITAAARRGFGDEELAHVLSPLRNAPLVATDLELDPAQLGLTHPELRALRLVLPAGTCQDAPLRALVDTARTERLARGREALFAAFIALSAGLLTTPGWHRRDSFG
jgi:hypothetical protein